mgnify:CR=1 FL=1
MATHEHETLVKRMNLIDKAEDVLHPRVGLPMCINIAAVIKVHDVVGETFEARPTMRQLTEKFEPECTGLLREYVCAFGKYGTEVVKRYVSGRYPDAVESFDQSVEEKAKEFLTVVMTPEFRESLTS